MAFRIIRKLDWTAERTSGDERALTITPEHNPYIANVTENETEEERRWDIDFTQESDGTGDEQKVVPVEIIQEKAVICTYKIKYGSDIPKNYLRYFVSGKTISLYDGDVFVKSGETNEYGEVIITVKNGKTSYRVVAEDANRGPYFDNLISIELQVKNAVEFPGGSGSFPDAPSDYTECVNFYDLRGPGYVASSAVTSDLELFNKEYFILGGKTFDKTSGETRGNLLYVNAKMHLDGYNVVDENGDTLPKSAYTYDATTEDAYTATVRIPADMDTDYGWRSSDMSKLDYRKYNAHQIPIWDIGGFSYYNGKVENNGKINVVGNASGFTVLNMISKRCEPENGIYGNTPSWLYWGLTNSFYKTPCADSNYGPERESTIKYLFNYNTTVTNGNSLSTYANFITGNTLNFYRDFISGTTIYEEMYKAKNGDFGKTGMTVDLRIIQKSGSTTINVNSNASGATVTLHRGSTTGDVIASGNIPNTGGTVSFTGICETAGTKIYAVIDEWTGGTIYTWEPNKINDNNIIEFTASGGEESVSLRLKKSEYKIASQISREITINTDKEYEVTIIATASTSNVSYKITEQAQAMSSFYEVHIVDNQGNSVYFEDLSAYESMEELQIMTRLVETHYGNGTNYTNYGDWETIDESGYTEEYIEGDGSANYTVFDQDSIKRFTLGNEYINDDGTHPSVDLQITRRAETVTANWDIATAISVPTSANTYTFVDDAYVTVYANTLDSNGDVDSGNTYIAWSGKIFNSGQKISAGTTSYVEIDDAQLIIPEHGASLSMIAITDIDGNVLSPTETISSGGTSASIYHERNENYILENGSSLLYFEGMAFTAIDNELVSLEEDTETSINEILLTLKFS